MNTGPPLSLPSTLEDPNWKGTPTGPDPQPNNGQQNNFGNANNSNFSGPVFSGQGSPAPGSGPNYQGGPPGSNTPQYTASPAPSGSSTPGPGPPQSMGNPGFPPPSNSAGPQFSSNVQQGQSPMSFGSPSGPNFGRPGHFPSPGPGGPGGNFGGGQFGMPPGSPFHGGHPMQGGMGPGHMMGQPMDGPRMDQG